jgi:hypothetical protein
MYSFRFRYTGYSLERLYKLNFLVGFPCKTKKWQEITSKFDDTDTQGLIQFEFKILERNSLV